MSDLLRRDIRHQRRALSAAKQQSAKFALPKILHKISHCGKPTRLAFYVASDGEIDPSNLINHSLKCGNSCYLPTLHPLQQKRLYFIPFNASTVLRKNRFGIDEPLLVSSKITPPWTLDVIFLPLVAFDRMGSRMGMGSGFYDRTLASRQGPSNRKPLLVGLAHSFQEVDKLRTAAWDVPLDFIATEKELITANPTPDYRRALK